jgi:hypothetical protein
VATLVLVLAATGCSAGNGSGSDESPNPALQTIELDVFSGRPNPSWQLDGEARKKLVSLLGALAPAQTPAPEVPGLGYRGFTFGLGGPARAYGGFVDMPLRVLSDPDRTVERFLMEQLPAEFGDVREVVRAELSS